MKERGNTFLRYVDRYLGIPLVFLLGLWKKKKAAPSSIERIALLKSAAIGDTVLLSGIIQDLRSAFPSATITLFCGSSNTEAARLIEGICVVPLPITHFWRALHILRGHSFDLWLDFDSWPRINAFFSFFASAKYTVGFKTKAQGRHYLYDKVIEHKISCHELDNYRTLVKSLGIKAECAPKIFMPAAPTAHTVVFHLFAGGSRARLKTWPMEHWLELATHLRELGYLIVLTGSQQDRERLAPFAQKEGMRIVAGELSLKDTAVLLASARAVVSVDTGIMHLAAAIGAPVIALHGPTSPARWGAQGPRVIALTPSSSYKPCLHLGFEKSCRENHCMRQISVKDVLQAIEPFLHK